jgi:hypothetical protein
MFTCTRGAQAAVERLDEALLLWFARFNAMPIHAVIASPLQDRATGELCAVITDDTVGLSIDASASSSRATLAPEMLVWAIRCPAGDCKAICREGAQVLMTAIVIHGQHTELA